MEYHPELNPKLATIDGKGSISAEVIKYSIYRDLKGKSKRIISFKLVHHRSILAQLNKHRQLANNYQSSRAVPTKTAVKDVWKNPAYPIEYMQNKSGMQAETPLSPVKKFMSRLLWNVASKVACVFALLMDFIGLHKQWVGRTLEPFQYTTGILTATELDNLFYLRRHPDTQPEFRELADCMYIAMQNSTPDPLFPGEWHVPYIDTWRDPHTGKLIYIDPMSTLNKFPITADEAKRWSAASVAQISFRKLNQEHKVLDRVYSRLVDGAQPHSVCMEHVATPIDYSLFKSDAELNEIIDNLDDIDNDRIKDEFFDEYKKKQKGITHRRLDDGSLWSGCFNGWIQARHLLENESCKSYSEHINYAV